MNISSNIIPVIKDHLTQTAELARAAAERADSLRLTYLSMLIKDRYPNAIEVVFTKKLLEPSLTLHTILLEDGDERTRVLFAEDSLLPYRNFALRITQELLDHEYDFQALCYTGLVTVHSDTSSSPDTMITAELQ